MSEIEIKVFRSFDDAKPYAEAWDDLVLRSGADIYMTYDWCRIWWKHYGRGRELRLLLGLIDGRVVGLIPFFSEMLWLGLVWVRVAKPVGADFSLQLCNLPLEDVCRAHFLELAIAQVFNETSCDLFVIGPLCGPAAHSEAIVAAAGRLEYLIDSATRHGKGCATHFDLPPTFADYLKQIGSRQRGNFNRGIKQLSASAAVAFDVVSDPSGIYAELNYFSDLHAEQWRQEGKCGHFGDWPDSLDFNRDLIGNLASQGKVRFYRILVDGKVVASQYCFIHARINYWRLPARTSNSSWESISLGKLGLIKMIQSSIEEGVRTIEGGRGHYDYKVQLGAQEWPLEMIEIIRRGRLLRIRVAVFRAVARMLDLIYYRIFYIRLLPRFPLLRHSLWPVWIRSVW